ncbi:cysteine hydrolase family protein [Gordonia sp. NPDC127522]|uniref:cysteine hydrolase family protein n=1 Tax=Gordonia sp. NPDC127522 TaxID=3345390 RepID=UPI003645E53D
MPLDIEIPEFPPVPVDDIVLVLTHMQNDFWHPEGSGFQFTNDNLPFPDTKERIASVVQGCRELGVPIIYHNETFRPGHPELKVRRNGYVRGTGRVLKCPEENMAVRGEWGANTLDEIAPQPGRPEFVVDNAKVDPFTCSEFDVLLRNLGRNIVVIAGLATDFGVSMTARSANERDYGVVVLSDCTDRMLGEYSEMTMQKLFPFLGRVMTSAELLTELKF